VPKPYIVAELSGNHNGDINRAFRLIEMAKIAGADAVKLQTYTADTITIDCDREDFMITGGLWDGYKLYDLYQKAHTPWEWHEALFEKGKELGITVFSTPFDETAVDLLESLGAPLYKIASFELVHHPLIAYIARLKKPIIMSTGMASLSEITEAVEVAMTNGCKDLTLLHCVSEYPAPIENCNLATMLDLKKRFPQVKVGLSDHTLGISVAIAAVALGANVIEKHVTLSRDEGGVDAAFSLEPKELEMLCKATVEAALAIGQVNYHRSYNENKNKSFRRSIYVVKDIKPGELFTQENIRVIRPGYGGEPKHLEQWIGQRADQFLHKGTPLKQMERPH
jgi:pseudaminic acid synthase